MLVALAISHLLMPAALTLQDYHCLCLWLVRNINKNPINMSFSLVETRVSGEKPLQAKQRADYFSLSLFLYLQCLKRTKKREEEKEEEERRKSYQDSKFIEIFLHAVFIIL